jgi:putative transposase
MNMGPGGIVRANSFTLPKRQNRISHQPFRRREQSMAKFRDMKTLQKFAAAHASIHNHFNHDRHLNRRDIFKQNRSAALAEWRQLAA